MTELDALLAAIREKAAAEAAPVAKSEEAVAAEAQPEAVAEPVAEPAVEAAPEAEVAKSEEAAAEAGAFEVTDAEGNKLQAVDGFALLKAMQEKLDVLAAAVEALPKHDAEAVAKSFVDAKAATDAVDAEIAKGVAAALEGAAFAKGVAAASEAKVADLTAALAAQGEVVKSLSDRVETFASQGAGRRSTVVIQERPSAVAKAAEAPTVGELFAKANALIREGKLNTYDAGRVNSSVNAGRGVPADLLPLFAA